MMHPATFLSNLGARRPNRTASIDAPPSNSSVAEDENHAVHEFQKVMEDIRRERPNLSIGAQKQMAIERCAQLNEEREAQCLQDRSKRFSVPEDLLKGVMSKLQLGGRQYGCATDGEDGIGSTVGSTTRTSSIDDPESKKSIAVFQSVVVSKDTQNMLAQMDWNDSEQDSLQGSLDDIERSTSCLEASAKSQDRRSSRNISRRYSRRLSGLTSGELFDVEEEKDEESGSKNAEDHDVVPSKVKQTQHDMAHNFESLPDEISVVLTKECDGDGAGTRNTKSEKNISSNTTSNTAEYGRRKGGRVSRGCHQSAIHQSTAEESNASSFLSVDSANFTGDFWAWRSVSSRSSQGS